MNKLITSLRVILVLTVLLGIIYPLAIMLIGQLCFPYQANGSLIQLQGKIVGSELIAQHFKLPKYFNSRFSTVNYDGSNSGASNLVVASQDWFQQLQQHRDQIRLQNQPPSKFALPSDMVFTSASGLDPHISLDNALLQLPRIAKERNLPPATVEKLIKNYLEKSFLGVWGADKVNVLKLNLALDQIAP